METQKKMETTFDKQKKAFITALNDFYIASKKLSRAWSPLPHEFDTYPFNKPFFELEQDIRAWVDDATVIMVNDVGFTEVRFLIEKDSETEVFAYFPNEYYNKELKPELRTSYAHVGQHSACHVEYAAECKEATPEQYAALKKELEGIGYELLIL